MLLEQVHKATGYKVILAAMEETHLKHLIKLLKDPELTELMGWDTFFEQDNIKGFLESVSDYSLPYSRKSQPIVFGIYSNLNDLPVGYVVLKGFNRELLTAEVGVATLEKKYRRRGYGKLALNCMINYGFNQLGLQTIASAILASNKTSTNMCKKLGFTIKETMHKAWLMPNGELADMLWMELTPETWKSLNK